MTDIKWQEPPENNRSKWSEIADALRGRPGQWALVKTSATNGAFGQYKARLGLEFEIVTRRNNEGNVDFYARFIGGESK